MRCCCNSNKFSKSFNLCHFIFILGVIFKNSKLGDYKGFSGLCCNEKPRRVRCKKCLKHYWNQCYRGKCSISRKSIICTICGKSAKNVNALKQHKSKYHRNPKHD